MDKTPQGWNIFDAQTPVLTYTYSFGPGYANALAVGGEGGLIVVSPPMRVDVAAMDDLTRYGEVRALVASNAFHYMGIPEWKKRFPDASVFAPAQSIPRVERQTGLEGIRPLADAADIAGSKLELVDMPHYKTGEVLVRINSARGLAWYLTDVVLNMEALPRHPVIRILFKVSKSGPGLKFNNLAPLFMVKDKAALKRWFTSELDRAPPRWLIPAHGPIVDLESNLHLARNLFASN